MSERAILVIRLSSMGDLVLSTAFLENLPDGVKVDWIVAEPFAFVLEGHPKIRKLIRFQKDRGLQGWIDLIVDLAKEKYDARIDLHGTIRSLIARFIFFLHADPAVSISKQRFRTWLYLVFKEKLPYWIRPTPYWQRFAKLGQKVGNSFLPIAARRSTEPRPPCYPVEFLIPDTIGVVEKYKLKPNQYLAVMPGSKWKSKEWGAEKFAAVSGAWHRRTNFPILVLGRTSDSSSVELLARLKRENIPAVSALETMSFAETAALLKYSSGYLGGDTGLAHLAEAVGALATMVFGPTRPSLGFGPWNPQSVAVSNPVFCAPCSKDGKRCYRFTEPYACLRRLAPQQVLDELAGSRRGLARSVPLAPKLAEKRAEKE